jgi:type VI secretion system protein VasJ
MGKLVSEIVETTVQPEFSVIQPPLVDALLMPIGEQGVGENPQYGDEFASVKHEINRLSDTDYPEIIRLCEKILQYEAKDLRVAGYYLMAKVFNEGIVGLLEAAELYYELIKRYGNECHPQREPAKYQAIAWLNNEKLATFVKNQNLTSDSEIQSVVRLKIVLASLNQELFNLYHEDVLQWTSLNTWVEKNLPSVREKSDEAHSIDLVSKHIALADKSEIASELAFTRSVERLLEYLANQRDLVRLISLSRAIKWSSLTLPDHEAGVTKVAPPRQAVIAAAELQNESGADESRLYELESLFVEAGSPFFLDLQLQEIRIASSAGRREIAAILESHLREVVKRLPKLPHLSFSDGTPFANEMTRRWLKQQESIPMSHPSQIEDNNSARRDSTIAKIMDEAVTCGLVSSIEKLSRIEAADQSQMFRLDLARIDMCINAGRADIALPLAQKLEKQVEQYRLAEWDKELALALWDKLLLIFQTLDKDSIGGRNKISELKGKICATDICFALGMF